MTKYNYQPKKDNLFFTRSDVPRNSNYPPDWLIRRDIVLKRDNHTCRYCGDQNLTHSLHVHHINPISKGGTHNIGNLICVCIKCHSQIHFRNEELNKKYIKEICDLYEIENFERTLRECYPYHNLKSDNFVPDEGFHYAEDNIIYKK
ncbi:HNH endonuclease [Methanomethylovorans sp.]|uniref:HNH endonuclease n=1 Tax=Methanomethylovorans sp. TaxID=2758717 RepID=UPI003D0B08B2